MQDAAGLYQYVKDKEIARHTFIHSPRRRADEAAFLKGAIAEMASGKQFLLAIRRYDDEEPIGLIGLHFHYPEPHRVELGFWLGKPFWGQGLMTQAVKLILAFAFDKLKLHRVDASHFEGNDASRRVIEKCWFRREGVAREAACKNQGWVNLVQYGLLKQEYEQLTGKATR
jgi:RimJ/RimL family protein N-acetyltransferase